MYEDDFSIVPVRKAGSAVQLVTLGTAAAAVAEPRQVADAALAKSGWKETREDLRRRFLDIVVSHVKDVRDAMETREQLVRATEKGGLGMSPTEADAVLAAVKEATGRPAGEKPRSSPPSSSAKAPATPPTAKPPAPPAPMAPPAPTPREKLVEAAKMLTSLPPKEKPGGQGPRPASAAPRPTVVTPTLPVPAPMKPLAPPERKPAPLAASAPPPRPAPAAQPAVPPHLPAAPAAPVAAPKPALPPSSPPALTTPTAKSQEPVVSKPDRPPPLPASRDEAVTLLANEVVRELGFRLPEKPLEDRLRYAVASRLRDIRDWAETEETLVRPANAGGLGLSPAQVAAVRAALEPRVERIHAELYARQKQEVTEALTKEKDRDRYRAELEKEQAQAAIDARFEAITGKSAVGVPVAEPTRAPREAARVGPEVHARIPISPSSASVPPTADRRPPMAQPRPTMTDVRPAARLTSPVEELRQLTVEDFRKLAADPTEGARKVMDKLALLEAESFSRRLEGIAALKQSPFLDAYFSILRGSVLQGTPIEQAIAARAAEKLPVLTRAEFDAILELNRMLRF